MAFVQRDTIGSNTFTPDYMTELSPEEIERRRLLRKVCTAPGVIVSSELPLPVPCIVRDMSPTGARIEIREVGAVPAARLMLPTTFMLELRQDRLEVMCALRWRRGPEIGVRMLCAPRPLAKGLR